MLKYAHIGYPKAASTWLQVYLFPRHKELFHFGRHMEDEIVNDDLRIALWNDLIARPSLLYDAEATASTFRRLYAQAAQTGVKACGVSQEVLTLSLIGGVDITERARRLRSAMGDGTRIIMIVRNQLDWIRSMFCGLLKEGGMQIGLEEFLFYFYYQQDQSPFSSLFYDDVHRCYADLFGADQVHVIPFELITRDAVAFAARVCEAIGVSPLAGVPSQSINERPSAKALTACLAYNRQRSFYFGTHPLRRPFASLAEPVFRKRLRVEPPAWMAEEREMSLFSYRHMEKAVQEAEKKGEVIPPMNTTIPDQYRDLLVRAYAPHNAGLMKLTGLDLAGLGYPV